jgi:divalent metal cation (Fe/Co/Zn/Cd) transporter
VLLEDGVAMIGIVLTRIVAGSGYFLGPHPEFDASIAIVVGLLLGAMALFLAAINRRILIDTSDAALDRAAEEWLRAHGIRAHVDSLILDDDNALLFVRAEHDVAQSHAIGEALSGHVQEALGMAARAVYWNFPKTVQPAQAAAGA